MKKLCKLIAVTIMGIAFSKNVFAEFEKSTFKNTRHSERYIAQFFPSSGSPFKRIRYKKRSGQRSPSNNQDMDYKNLVFELKYLRSLEELEAFQMIPNFDILVNWHLGEKIVGHMAEHQKQTGDKNRLFTRLAVDLSVEKSTLVSIVVFYRSYTDVSNISTDLTWAHYVELIKVTDRARRKAYQKKAILKGWSSDELKKQIPISP